jgi:hypothetical protein
VGRSIVGSRDDTVAQAPERTHAPAPAPHAARPWQLLDGTMLKWVAIVTMLVDHVAITLVYPEFLALRGTAAAVTWADAYNAMRDIGRIAFPLFCFALTEGLAHTHDRPRYALRLFLFALVSEIPFDLALNDGKVSFVADTNVMYTLFVCFMALWAGDSIRRAEGDRLPGWAGDVVTIALLAAGAMVDIRLTSDYSWFGILLGGSLYLTRQHRLAQVACGTACTVLYCLINARWIEMYALIGLALILFYNGKRGRGMKCFFYAFYPGHLLILAGIHALVF